MEKQDNRTRKRIIGDLGEAIACDFLRNRGFEIVERNYLKKWGEIDIVAKKGDILHFIEVKSVSCVTLHKFSQEYSYRPEDNMHPWKLKRLSRTMQTYLLEKNLECDYQLDLVTVRLNDQIRKARVEIVENIII